MRPSRSGPGGRGLGCSIKAVRSSKQVIEIRTKRPCEAYWVHSFCIYFSFLLAPLYFVEGVYGIFMCVCVCIYFRRESAKRLTKSPMGQADVLSALTIEGWHFQILKFSPRGAITQSRTE
jgi:hypothetical protein